MADNEAVMDFADRALQTITTPEGKPPPKPPESAAPKDPTKEPPKSKIPDSVFEKKEPAAAEVKVEAKTDEFEIDKIPSPDFKDPTRKGQWETLKGKALEFEKKSREAEKKIAEQEAKIAAAEGKECRRIACGRDDGG